MKFAGHALFHNLSWWLQKSVPEVGVTAWVDVYAKIDFSCCSTPIHSLLNFFSYVFRFFSLIILVIISITFLEQLIFHIGNGIFQNSVAKSVPFITGFHSSCSCFLAEDLSDSEVCVKTHRKESGDFLMCCSSSAVWQNLSAACLRHHTADFLFEMGPSISWCVTWWPIILRKSLLSLVRQKVDENLLLDISRQHSSG